ncbi:MAG TPA: Holliday junction branch migration protein RuvA, partial [Nitrospiria bacterium]|nr:Holliday junction branch migration protein RuvA [Nitrospiria bacterium]
MRACLSGGQVAGREMIASIAGVLISKSPNSIIVDVHGVGYQVFIPLSTFYRLPELSKPVTLHTYTHVREDALQLYGFFHQEEKAVFLLLLGISGIGPKLAVNILSGLPL